MPQPKRQSARSRSGARRSSAPRKSSSARARSSRSTARRRSSAAAASDTTPRTPVNESMKGNCQGGDGSLRAMLGMSQRGR